MNLELAFPTGRPEISEAGMTEDERAVLRALRWGREQARRVDHLAMATGLTGRKVQAIVRELRESHGVPVGTAMGEPFGCYLVDAPEELAQVFALFRSRGLSNLRQAAKLRGISLAAYLREVQGELDVA